MSKINYILGGDSITVFLDGNSYTINKQAHTYELVLKAVRDGNVDALRDAINIRQGIVKSLVETGGSKVRIEEDAIYYDDREVTGLIASRIFEMLRLGLSVKPMVRFLENMMENPSKRAVDELFGFIDACRLPITEDGHFLAYKRVRDNYFDVHSGTMDNSVGKILEMPRNMVDEDKNRTCSTGLHFCSYDYLAHFGGERIMVLKINPRDVVAIPADYNNSKGRTCRYEVVDELPVNEYRMPERTIDNDYTDKYGSSGAWDEPEVAEESWEESWEESDYSEEDDIQAEIDFLTPDEVSEILELYAVGTETVKDIADDYSVSEDAIHELARRKGVGYGSAKVLVKPVKASSANTTSKLTPADVKQIRRLLNHGDSLASIARQFGVHPRSIARIRDGEAWNDV